ncbi:MAG: T9SS type A sorting domain-containing protein, partial [Flavobacteriales bacterium]
DTTRFTTGPLGPSNGNDYALVSDGDGGAAAFWFNWQNNAIYAARLDRNGRMGDFTGVEELERSNLSLFPNPATDRITLQSRDGGALGIVRILSAEGRTVRELGMHTTDRTELDIQGLGPGLYTVIASTRNASSHLHFVKQ